MSDILNKNPNFALVLKSVIVDKVTIWEEPEKNRGLLHRMWSAAQKLKAEYDFGQVDKPNDDELLTLMLDVCKLHYTAVKKDIKDISNINARTQHARRVMDKLETSLLKAQKQISALTDAYNGHSINIEKKEELKPFLQDGTITVQKVTIDLSEVAQTIEKNLTELATIKESLK